MILTLLLGLAQAHKPPAKAANAVSAAKPAPKASTAATAAPPLPESWTFRENKDPAQGVLYTSVSTKSADGYRLVLRCDRVEQPVVSVQFIPPVAPGTADDKYVTVMPDAGAALVTKWEFPGPGAINRADDMFKIVEMVAHSKHLRIATTNSSGEPISGGFEGPGGDAPFRQVYASCGWNYGPYVAPPPPKPAAPAAPAKPVFTLGPAPQSGPAPLVKGIPSTTTQPKKP